MMTLCVHCSNHRASPPCAPFTYSILKYIMILIYHVLCSLREHSSINFCAGSQIKMFLNIKLHHHTQSATLPVCRFYISFSFDPIQYNHHPHHFHRRFPRYLTGYPKCGTPCKSDILSTLSGR